MLSCIAAEQCEQEDVVLKFTLNGTAVAVDAPPDARLLFVLNNDLDQHGVNFGCGLSQCGACTVLVDGEPVRSCQAAAQSDVEGNWNV